MEKATRYAEISEIKKGIAFSDPFYDATVWCQYRKEFKAGSWVMKLETARDEDDYIQMTLTVCRRTFHSGLSIEEIDNDISISYPGRYITESVEIGIDTAKVFAGTLDNFEQWGEEGSIYTGADGMFGQLHVFTCRGEDTPAGFLLTSAVDGGLTTEEELFRTLLSSFDGKEIDKARFDEITDKNHLSVRLQASAELNRAEAASKGNIGPKKSDKSR